MHEQVSDSEQLLRRGGGGFEQFRDVCEGPWLRAPPPPPFVFLIFFLRLRTVLVGKGSIP